MIDFLTELKVNFTNKYEMIRWDVYSLIILNLNELKSKRLINRSLFVCCHKTRLKLDIRWCMDV